MSRDALPAYTDVSDGLVITGSQAWLYVRMPRSYLQYNTVEDYETHANQFARAINSITPDSGELAIHLRLVREEFAVDDWANNWPRNEERLNADPSLRARSDRFLSDASDHLDRRAFVQSVPYLGILLPQPDTGTGGLLKGFLDGLGILGGKGDPAVSEEVQAHYRKQADVLFSRLQREYPTGGGTEQLRRATTRELLSLIRAPFEEVTGSDGIPRNWDWADRDKVRAVVDHEFTVHAREVEFTSPSTYFTSIGSLAVMPDYVEWPQQLSWLGLVVSQDPLAEVSIRATIVPSRQVVKRLERAKAAAQEEANEAFEVGADDAGVDHLAHTSRVGAKLKTAKTRDTGWIDMTCRIQVTETSQEAVAERRENLKHVLREAGYVVEFLPHEQFPLLIEAMPGGKWQYSLHRLQFDLEHIGATGILLDYQVGDQRGMYVGYTQEGDHLPMLLDPNYACETNRPPGLLITGRPGFGKALSLDTPIPTPTGWTTMGALNVGDEVLDESGAICRVAAATETMYDHDCFEVEFDDGHIIVADGEHRWLTQTRSDRKAASEARSAARVVLHTPEQVEAVRKALREMDPDIWAPLSGIREGLGEGAPEYHFFSNATKALRASGIQPVKAGGVNHWPARAVLAEVERRIATPVNDQRGRILHAPQVRDTYEIARTLRVGSEGRANHSVDVAGAWDLPEANLPVDPYVLGVWLGDGYSRSARFCGVDPEIADEVRRRGYAVSEARDSREGYGDEYRVYTVLGLSPQLRALGILKTKSTPKGKAVPAIYLRGSVEQRLDLLRGLMDTDGTISKSGVCALEMTNEDVVLAAREIAHSLGIKTSLSTKRVDGRSEATSTVYRLSFVTDLPVFSLPRKLARLPKSTRPTQSVRYIVDVRPVESVPVRCIAVDSESRLYLAGEAGIPTHNTALTLTLAYHAYLQGKTVVYIDPKSDSDDMAVWIGQDRINYIDMTAAQSGLLDPFVTARALDGNDPNLGFNGAVNLCTVLTGVQNERLHKDAIVEAVRAVIDESEATGVPPCMNALVDKMLSSDERIARSLGAELSGYRSDPYGRLLFSDGEAALQDAAGRFTIIVLNGLSLPEQTMDREEFQPEHRIAMAVMSATVAFAQRLMMLDAMSGEIGARKQTPKAIFMDEAWTLFATPEGRQAANSILRLGRSMNTAFALVTQRVADIPNADAYISTHFAFNPGPGKEDSEFLLQALGLDIDPKSPSMLRQGECFVRDVDGRKGRVMVELWNKELFEAIDTTPGAPTADSSPSNRQ